MATNKTLQIVDFAPRCATVQLTVIFIVEQNLVKIDEAVLDVMQCSRQFLVKFSDIVFAIAKLTDRQTHRENAHHNTLYSSW